MKQCDLGLIGMAVMGQNLVLNMDDYGYKVAVYNRTTSKTDDFLQGNAKGTRVVGAYSLEELVNSLKRPRGKSFHTNWRGSGGEATSGSYKAQALYQQKDTPALITVSQKFS